MNKLVITYCFNAVQYACHQWKQKCKKYVCIYTSQFDSFCLYIYKLAVNMLITVSMFHSIFSFLSMKSTFVNYPLDFWSNISEILKPPKSTAHCLQLCCCCCDLYILGEVGPVFLLGGLSSLHIHPVVWIPAEFITALKCLIIHVLRSLYQIHQHAYVDPEKSRERWIEICDDVTKQTDGQHCQHAEKKIPAVCLGLGE